MNKSTLNLVLLLVFFLNIFSLAQDRYNYADVWNKWDAYTRYVFLWGFQDGSNSTYIIAGDKWLKEGDWFKEPELPKVKAVREKTALFFDLEIIRDVITDLYKEPTNSFIPFSYIILLARDKLRGDDIEEALRDARKNAHENYLLLQKMNNKK